MPRILVIDDEKDVREAMERALTSPSISVVSAPDAAAGFALLREETVDLVILEIVLPGMDGVAAIKEIRRIRPDVRIIAISGGGNSGLSGYRPESISTIAYLAAGTAAGADGVLAKPFETAELRSLIKQVFAPQPQ